MAIFCDVFHMLELEIPIGKNNVCEIRILLTTTCSFLPPFHWLYVTRDTRHKAKSKGEKVLYTWYIISQRVGIKYDAARFVTSM